MHSELHKAELALRALVLGYVEWDKDELTKTMLEIADIIKDARGLYESDIDPFQFKLSAKAQKKSDQIDQEFSQEYDQVMKGN